MITYRDPIDEKIRLARDRRARRAATRWGLRLQRSKQQGPGLDRDTYRVIDGAGRIVAAGPPPARYGLTIEQVEALLRDWTPS